MLALTTDKAKEILENIKGQQIVVVGDVMLDRYFWGEVSRVSPEAPVPVVDIQDETFHLGGAANVARNLRSLGAIPVLCGLLGTDEAAEVFIKECKDAGIISDGLFRDKNRATTVKTRIIGNNQQIVRLDKEVRAEINSLGEKYILSQISALDKLEAIIFEDYDKGVVSRKLIRKIVAFAHRKKIPVFVDPKHENFSSYKGVTLFKPNKKETEKGLGVAISTQEEIIAAGKKIQKILAAENVLITLGAAGMMLFEKDGSISSVPTMARKVADVSGAGDTAIATFAATFISGANCREAALLANFASGIVCEKPGIVAIEKTELLESIEPNMKNLQKIFEKNIDKFG